jgi:hypothetical protein
MGKTGARIHYLSNVKQTNFKMKISMIEVEIRRKKRNFITDQHIGKKLLDHNVFEKSGLPFSRSLISINVKSTF